MARLLAYLQPSQGLEAGHFFWQMSKYIVQRFSMFGFGSRLRDRLLFFLNKKLLEFAYVTQQRGMYFGRGLSRISYSIPWFGHQNGNNPTSPGISCQWPVTQFCKMKQPKL